MGNGVALSRRAALAGGVPVSPSPRGAASLLLTGPAGAVYLPRTAAYGKTSTVVSACTGYPVFSTHTYVTYFFPGAGPRARRRVPRGPRRVPRRLRSADCAVRRVPAATSAFDCHKINISNTFPYTLRHAHTQYD